MQYVIGCLRDSRRRRDIYSQMLEFNTRKSACIYKQANIITNLLLVRTVSFVDIFRACCSISHIVVEFAIYLRIFIFFSFFTKSRFLYKATFFFYSRHFRRNRIANHHIFTITIDDARKENVSRESRKFYLERRRCARHTLSCRFSISFEEDKNASSRRFEQFYMRFSQPRAFSARIVTL